MAILFVSREGSPVAQAGLELKDDLEKLIRQSSPQKTAEIIGKQTQFTVALFKNLSRAQGPGTW